jgi:hypothetical protein
MEALEEHLYKMRNQCFDKEKRDKINNWIDVIIEIKGLDKPENLDNIDYFKRTLFEIYKKYPNELTKQELVDGEYYTIVENKYLPKLCNDISKNNEDFHVSRTLFFINKNKGNTHGFCRPYNNGKKGEEFEVYRDIFIGISPEIEIGQTNKHEFAHSMQFGFWDKTTSKLREYSSYQSFHKEGLSFIEESKDIKKYISQKLTNAGYENVKLNEDGREQEGFNKELYENEATAFLYSGEYDKTLNLSKEGKKLVELKDKATKEIHKDLKANAKDGFLAQKDLKYNCKSKPYDNSKEEKRESKPQTLHETLGHNQQQPTYTPLHERKEPIQNIHTHTTQNQTKPIQTPKTASSGPVFSL